LSLIPDAPTGSNAKDSEFLYKPISGIKVGVKVFSFDIHLVYFVLFGMLPVVFIVFWLSKFNELY